MRSTRLLLIPALLFAGTLANAAPVTGTVTDKTTGKPAAGDPVVVVDVQAGMSEVAHATTDAKGHYSINPPGAGPYLIRVTHQGAGYFIAAPQGGAPGDIPVYDVAAKVQGVFIEADVIEAETDPSGALKVDERYFVHNTSSPPTTQWSPKSFEIVLPPDALVTDTGAQRPGGLPTSVKMDSDGPKGHYSFNFPIQPDDGDKDTLFQISYTLPYSDQKYTFKPQVTLPADNVAILLPKSMTFTPGAGSDFRTVNEDPSVQTFLLKNATPGKAIAFTISGQGAIPRNQQADNGAQASAGPGSQPGGGIGEPINTPDPLSKYKWWILGGLALLLAAAAAFLLRRPPAALAGVPAQAPLPPQSATAFAAQPVASTPPTTAAKNGALLSVLKEELFAVESEKIAGTLSAADYAEQKAALEVVLKRALKRQ
ncbi:MAG TPA: carboxypeptidase regulatory-like domain-containing protein [Terracidiphilus sp.]|nr:carboxypeptidase regulatory-like domain-containing protein [Terracidiphilus sp.]